MSLLKLLPPSTRNELSCLGIRKDLSPKSLTKAGTLLTLGSPKYREAASIVDLATGHVKNAHARDGQKGVIPRSDSLWSRSRRHDMKFTQPLEDT